MRSRFLYALLVSAGSSSAWPPAGSPAPWRSVAVASRWPRWDTGLSIANTGQQPGGPIGQGGTCLVSFFGSNPPADLTTPVVAQGQTRQILMSVVAPNFQGYAVATCQFPLAHGFYFVGDVGFTDFAHGGHALVLPPERDTEVVEALGS